MKHPITSTNAPQAVGPYSQAIRSGPFIFLSGQIPLSPKTGQLIKGDITQQTRQIMTNLQAILQEIDATFDDVVKTTIFLTNMHDYADVNIAYGEYFSDVPPARSTIQVAALPLSAQIEIEMIVYKHGAGGCKHHNKD